MVSYTTPVFTSLIILVILDYSTEHFILPFEECFLADLCNHTWIPECGKENSESDLQTFLDDCHRHEYNCDNNKDYRKVELDECENNTTTTATATTTSVTTSTTVSTTTSTGSTTTTTEKPLTTTRTKPTTTTKQPIPTITEPTTTITESTTNTTEATKTIISTASTKPSPEYTPVNHNCSRTPPQETVQKNCSYTIISTTTTIKKPTEITSTESTTLSTTPTSKTTNATTELITTPTTEPITTPTAEPTTLSTTPTSKTTNAITERITTPTTEPITTPTTEPTTTSKTTINVTTIKSSISEPETTKPVSITSINDTVDIKENTIPQNSVTPKLVRNKKSCPLEGCDLPTTWVTTAKGEVRDFFQILREKYGAENVKLLRATTHWPRRVGWTKSYRDPFIFGKHVDSGGNVI